MTGGDFLARRRRKEVGEGRKKLRRDGKEAN
jgi:hypothetical protein